ncbi:MAG TPA: hypothetical protein PLZ32_14240 [Saprospiraceae bacterium]|nr:hypothetical protein [Saprospiraceae bacterium]
MKFSTYLIIIVFWISACKPNTDSAVPPSTIDDTNYDGTETSNMADSNGDTLPIADTLSYHDEYKGRSITGHFRYMADAPSFIPCNETKSYNVAMEGEEYLKTERSYLNSVENGGDPAFIEVLGAWEQKMNMEDRLVKSLVIHQLIELNPYRECE